MARYLTPAKICTLIIVESYLLNRGNPDLDTKLLALIVNQLHPAVTPQDNHGPPENAATFAESLGSIPSNFPGRTYYEDFVRTAWTIADLDQLHHLFDRLYAILTPDDPEERKVTPASPIGHFIRRCNVEWTRLRFADSLALLNAYKLYITPTWGSWTRIQPDVANMYASKDSNSDSVPSARPSVSSTSAPLISSDDIDSALSSSIHSLQKLGARVPAELKAKLNSWLLSHQQASDTQNLHHFMDFFEAWRAGQYTLALEELHRYFDYSIATKGNATGSEGEGVKVYYQYALLHLSVLHADFERWEEALSTMEECIATARENQDTACLNFALSWLLYLRQAHNLPSVSSLRSLAALAGDGGSEQDELAFLKAKAKDGKHWSLVSSTLLEEAKLELRHGGISAKALEYIIQSAHLNVQHASYSLMPAVTIFQASVYDRLGQSHTASRHYASVVTSLGKECSLGDRVRAQCRLAYAMAQNGQYEVARKSLFSLHGQIRGTLKLEQRVAAFSTLVALVQAIRNSDLAAANAHLSQLMPLTQTSDSDLSHQTSLLEISRLMHPSGPNLPSAYRKIASLLDQTTDLAQTLHLLTLKAAVFAAAGKPEKGFSIAVRAASRAERAGLVPVLLEALAALAEILNKVGEFVPAKELAEAALPQAFESGIADLPPRFFLLLTSSCAGLANPAVMSNETERMKSLRQATTWAQRARELSARLGDFSAQHTALMMKAALAAELGDDIGVKEAEDLEAQLARENSESVNARRS